MKNIQSFDEFLLEKVEVGQDIKDIKSAEALLSAMQNKTLVIHSNVRFNDHKKDLRNKNTLTLDTLHQFKIDSGKILYLPFSVNYNIWGYDLKKMNEYYTNHSFNIVVKLEDVFDFFTTMRSKKYYIELRDSELFDESLQTNIVNLSAKLSELDKIVDSGTRDNPPRKVRDGIVGFDTSGSWDNINFYTIGNGRDFTEVKIDKNDYYPIKISKVDYNQRPNKTYAVNKNIVNKWYADCLRFVQDFTKLQNDLLKVARQNYIKK